ncbi:MAG: hypothetical protein JWO80_3669 [Bryobacterales bacterium]|nr:hypothetical protein [Bryobacterales bacterium]
MNAPFVRRLRARLGNGTRLYLTEWKDGTWSYSIFGTKNGEAIRVSSDEGLPSKDDAQHAALNAALDLFKGNKEGIPERLEWEVMKPRTLKGRTETTTTTTTQVVVDKNRAASFAQFVAATLGLLAAAGATLFYGTTFSHPPSEYAVLNEQNKKQQAQIEILDKTLRSLNGKLSAVSQSLKANPANSKLLETISGVEIDIKDLKRRLSSFEISIGDDPAKRVAALLLRKDLDTATDKEKSDIAILQGQFSQTFDTMKWLIALLGGGIVAGIVSTWLSRPKQQ